MSPNDLDFTRRVRLADGTVGTIKIHPAGRPGRAGWPCRRRVFVTLGEAKTALDAVFEVIAEPDDTEDQAARRTLEEIRAIGRRLGGVSLI